MVRFEVVIRWTTEGWHYTSCLHVPDEQIEGKSDGLLSDFDGFTGEVTNRKLSNKELLQTILELIPSDADAVISIERGN